LSRFLEYSAWFRRPGASAVTQYAALVVGLPAMAALTVPDVRGDFGIWLTACLWCCLGYFAAVVVLRARAARKTGALGHYLLSYTGLTDLLGVIPVPAALVLGVAPASAWLFASLWLLKLTQNSPGLALLGRVFKVEARALTGVAVLFLIILFVSSALMHVIERDSQPAAFGTLPATLWWAVVTLTTTGYGDAVPKTALGHFLGSMVMVAGIATFGLWTGILAIGFAAEGRRRNFIQTWDLVSKVPFFQSLDPSSITEITRMLRRIEVPERTAIIRRGKVGDCMYFIASGEVEVDVPPAPVRLGEGAFFGELALLGDSIRTANVSTTQAATLLVLDLADFRTVMANHAELARAIEDEAKKRRGDIQRRREQQVRGGAA
jgi:voltage-gated potassium channel